MKELTKPSSAPSCAHTRPCASAIVDRPGNVEIGATIVDPGYSLGCNIRHGNAAVHHSPHLLVITTGTPNDRP
jgi:hypothetical protein